MKKLYLLLAAVMISMTAGAKEVTLEASFLRNITFDVADGMKCVYNAADSAKVDGRDIKKGELRYALTSGDGMELYVYLYEIANLDREKASAVPDTALLRGLNGTVIERQQPVDGELDRIITIRNKKGAIQREYIGFYADGIICFSAVSPSGDFSIADKTAMSVGSNFRWGNLLIIIICVLIVLIPSFIIASGWNYRKSNLPKFWKRIITGLGLSVIIGIAGSLIFGFPLLAAIFWMLVMAIAGGVLFSIGDYIIIWG